MTSAHVLIPYRPDEGPRDRHLAWVLQQWREQGLVQGAYVGMHKKGLWNKAKAVAKALAHSQADVVVIADADVWMPKQLHLAKAIEHVADNGGWAMPHHYVHRLTEEASELYKDDPSLNHKKLGHDRVAYGGMIGGGMFVIRRTDYLKVGGLDPAFEGHTGEDEALGYLLSTLLGYPWRGRGDLVHLWHPAQPTKHDPQVRAHNEKRLQQYKMARGKQGPMSRRSREIREAISPTLAEQLGRTYLAGNR